MTFSHGLHNERGQHTSNSLNKQQTDHLKRNAPKIHRRKKQAYEI